MDVEAWLRCLGLEQYAGAFAEHRIGPKTLVKPTGEDLKEIGRTGRPISSHRSGVSGYAYVQCSNVLSLPVVWGELSGKFRSRVGSGSST